MGSACDGEIRRTIVFDILEVEPTDDEPSPA